MTTLTVGIDPGLSGALAFISVSDEGVQSVALHDTPTFQIKKGKKTKNEYDLTRMVTLLSVPNIEIVYLEGQQPFPKQGSVSNYSTGLGFGLWRGILAALKIPFEEIHPRVWQREFFTGKAGESKALAYKVASALYPNTELKGPRGGLLDGRCDALLLATLAMRRHAGASG